MTTIAYDRPVKDLIAEHNKSGHVTHKSYNKKSVTLHHNGGAGLSHEDILRIWKTRKASAHFDVDEEGDEAQYVKALEYAWATGSTIGNIETISIEMANLSNGPDWLVGEKTWRSAARLAGWLFAKVIKARPNKGNFFVHNHWKATVCAGPFIEKIWPQIMKAAQEAYDEFTKTPSTPKPPVPPAPSKPKPKRKTDHDICVEVWQGKWGSGDDRIRRLDNAGYDGDHIQRLVNQGVGRDGRKTAPVKSAAVLAAEVMAGYWGNGADRKRRLKAAGYDADAVQTEVNRRLR